MVLGIEAKASSMLGKQSTTELHSPSPFDFFRNVVLLSDLKQVI